MYKQHFGFTELPFSIVPNSRFLFQSQRHKEALFRLQAGLGEGGGFAMLSGEVGTGKTTVARALLKSLGSDTQPGLILNPTFSSIELLEAICDEFSIEYQTGSTLKQLNQKIHEFLLCSYANGVQTLLVIDEAQHLSAEVLEQLRLLTNLETDNQKLLKVLLVGQPELQQKLQMPQLRQLAQRITGRYHLLPLDIKETASYIQYRLELAGGEPSLFSARSLKHIAQQSLGIPRLINLICDAALKRAYSIGETIPSHASVEQACEEIMSFQTSYHPPQAAQQERRRSSLALASAVGAIFAVGSYWLAPQLVNQQIQDHLRGAYPPQQSITEEKEVFPTQLQATLARSTNFQQGIAELYHVWGLNASVAERLCQPTDQSVFRCAESNGTLTELKQANVPVLLSLRKDGLESYAVLYKLSHDTAQLLLGTERIELPIAKLNQLWQGQYYQIWQSYWRQTLKPRMSGQAIAALDQRLSEVLGESQRQSDVYDQELMRKVKLFQQWQGLHVDGIAGRQTLQRLEKLSQDNAPSLNVSEEKA
ncbi:AAA family ATPase [Vibrio sp. Isolate25]|uniref:ExeA family protein n=1 Tax=Vibrio sp. Isolate25 TaxID=2908535 RepID=UPI001EFD2950|nr:ExeA family protein [Vibrio sp. Isolate25]MCG9598335.1 AAA family ATPase [Vibrio sp. Isolate25]